MNRMFPPSKAIRESANPVFHFDPQSSIFLRWSSNYRLWLKQTLFSTLILWPLFPYTDASRDEENWRAQYGQVVHSREEPVPGFHAVDLWDWEMVKGSRKVGKGQEARLAGQLVKRSAKSHPSMPSSCSRFRTAPICEVHLDLVRVRTGSDFASFSR